MGKTEKRELASQLTLLLPHLLKWRFQPGRRSPDWEVSIKVQRNLLADHLDDNPSLKPLSLPSRKNHIKSRFWKPSRRRVFRNPLSRGSCPWSFDKMMDADFWPEEQNH
jgi:hypothetical protein